MKTPEQLKGAIRHMAVSQKLSAQQVLQMFLFERILERLANSPYSQNFILKGGLLISSIIGISARTTLDMDTTVRGIQMEEDEIQRIVQQILSIDVDDGIAFSYRKIQPIREDDAYNNFRIHIDAIYGRVRSPMKIDITTGDEITPEAIRHQYPLMFENRSIPILAYSLETILAEKYETIIRRSIATTRARDYYDLHILFNNHGHQINPQLLQLAVSNTARKRQSLEALASWRDVLKAIKGEKALDALWTAYTKDNTYASAYTFAQTLETVEAIGQMITEKQTKG